MNDVWPAVLDSIERRVSTKSFNIWFKSIKFLESDGSTVYLGVPDSFTRDWIKDHGLKDIIQEEFASQTGMDLRVILRIVDMPERMAELEAMRSKAHDETQSDEKQTTVEDAIRASGLNPRYVFDEFVVGPSNQLAYAASVNVAENPGTAYNPLFLYGGAGLGKTHLLNAIAHKVLQDRPSTLVLYTSTETFVNELINSIRTTRMDSFRDKYRSNCDLLLLDDIQFISGKVRTQEEFFHTFNSLYESHRQIIITSDRYPQEIPELEDRLRTRFQWGLIADIQPPEIETRIAILQRKAESEGLDIPDDVAMYIASSVKTNVREIEGSLKRLGAFASMYGKPITLDFARDVLKDTLGCTTPLNIEDVQKAVGSFFNVKLSELKGNRRHRSISRPRQIAMYICRNYLNSTYPDIGNRFNKDHSTAISAIRNVEKLIETDLSIREAIEAIKRQLGL
ncbi:MAG: chromosomal replication initiator protein DnaA [Deltaproteobacteria bacterium]|nr:chromosomal replication initiator protein DnaA [Deltaproteobacteria bacterium]